MVAKRVALCLAVAAIFARQANGASQNGSSTITAPKGEETLTIGVVGGEHCLPGDVLALTANQITVGSASARCRFTFAMRSCQTSKPRALPFPGRSRMTATPVTVPTPLTLALSKVGLGLPSRNVRFCV
jgi:hypothetical protein